MGKKELQVAAIENGTVIDHIPAEKTYEVAKLLNLQTLTEPVTIGYNLPSSKLGKKGIIKIADKYFTVVDKAHGIVKCHYCDKEQQLDDVKLV